MKKPPSQSRSAGRSKKGRSNHGGSRKGRGEEGGGRKEESGGVDVEMLRGPVRKSRPGRVKPPKKRSDKYNSRNGHRRDNINVDDVHGAIELAQSNGRLKSKVLTSVGLWDDPEEAEANHRWVRKNRSGFEDYVESTKGREDDTAALAEGYDDDDDDDDDDSFDDENDEYESFDVSSNRSDQHTWCESTKSIINKLFWVVVAVLAIAYVLYDDEKLEEEEEEEDVIPKREPYSFNGYKDGRIPDDDIAQFGGGIIGGEVFGIDTNETDYESETEEIPTTHTGNVQDDKLWDQLNGYAEMREPYNSDTEVAVFWHIPKCGGTTLAELMLHCIGMVGANEIGAKYVKEGVEVVKLENGDRVANVDMSNPKGIAHAKRMHFASSEVADVVTTSWFGQAASVFDDNYHKGRCFTLLRHPIKRAISMFYYLKDATWENTYSEVYKTMTVEEWAASEYAEDNWMVRFLTNKTTGGVYEPDLVLAMQVLESKCLVGIMEEFKPSFKRFSQYFGWGDHDFGGPVKMTDRGNCLIKVMSNPDNAHSHPNFEEGSEVWSLLMEKNEYDLALYEHAVHLFHDVQSKLVNNRL